MARVRVSRLPGDRRVGERHHRARLTDHDVELVRTLHEEHGLGYKSLARKFDAPVSTVRDVCKYLRRT